MSEQTVGPGNCVLEHRHEPERPRRAIPGLICCLGCRHRLDDALADLPSSWAELVDRHLGGGAGGPFITGTPEKRIPYRDPIGDERELIRAQLASWSALLGEEQRLGFPVNSEPTTTAAWLRERLDIALGQPWADEFANEILERSRNAHSLLYPTGRRRFPITAPDGSPVLCTELVTPDEALQEPAEAPCGGQLYASIHPQDDLLPSKIACETCGKEIPASGWYAYGRKVVKETELRPA